MDQHVAQNQSLVLSVSRRIFKPLARFLLANGITLPAIQEMLKQVLVEVAIQNFPVAGKATTDSRISVLTGVHRKDVKRLREMEPTNDLTPRSVSLGSQIINVWTTDRRWLNKQKQPLALPRLSSKKGMKSFEALVESVSKDVRSRAVLDELLRSGIVEDKEGVVHLKIEAFIPKEGYEESLYYLARGVSSHLNASVSNVQGEGESFFDRMVHYETIPVVEADKLSRQAGKLAMQFLKQVNQQAKKQSKPAEPDSRQLTVGVYVYHGVANDNQTPGDEK